MRRWRGLLLSGTALSLGAAISLAGSPAALAACTAAGAAPVAISCDDTTTDNTDNPPNNVDARNQVQNDNIDAEVQAGATVDGYGLRIETTLAGGTIEMDHQGTLVELSEGPPTADSPSAFGPGALELNGNGGLITYTGSGDVSNLTATGAGLLITNTGDGSVDAVVSGEIDGPSGIIVSVAGDGTIDLTTNEAVEGTDGDGILTTAEDGATAITADDVVTGTEAGINATSTGTGTITITGAGNYEGGTQAGISAVMTGLGPIAGDGIVISGTGTTTSTAGTAIIADIQNAANDSGILITRSGAMDGATGGIDASTVGNGTVTVTVANDVTVTAGPGIETSAVDGATTITASAGTVSGSTFGADATSTGAGTITVTGAGNYQGGTEAGISAVMTGLGPAAGDGIVISGTGATTSTAGPAIIADIQNAANDSDILINRSGAINGATGGVDASTAGGGDIVISGIGPVTTTAGIGISATAAGGDVAITPSSTVSGETGIAASTTGAGTIAVTVADAVTGTAGDGIVTSAENGDSAITADAAVTGADDGIDATATGAGSIAIVANAAVTGDDDGIVARTTTGSIGITGDGPVTGDDDGDLDGDGINAASTAGGSIGVDVGAVSGASGIVLSAVGAGTIDLTTGSAVVGTVGDGINTAAVDGDTAIMANGAVTGAEDGIDASATGAGAISILADETVTGVDDGINAGSTTGNITVAGAGNITGDSDGDNTGDGINAASTNGGNIGVNVTGDVSGASGIVLSTTLAGSIGLTTGGAVDGTAGDGINTVAVNGATAIITNAPVTGSEDGLDATATGTGAISVLANGTVDGIAGDGIVTSTAGGATAIETNAAVAGGIDGIDTTTTGAGAISILANGSVDGFTGDGIVTSAFNGATAIETNGPVNGADDGIDATTTGVGAISILANGSVDGFFGDGIVTSAVGGDTALAVNGAVEGGDDGIDATATGAGNINVAVAGGAEVTGLAGSGVTTTTAAGTATIDNAGLIEGAFAAISGATSTMVDIFNQAGGVIRNLSADIGDLAISVTGTGVTDIDNGGTIRGRVELGSGNDTFDNSGLWATSGTSDFGAGNDGVTNTGRVDAADLAAMAEVTHLANLEAFTNAGTGVIDMVDGNAPNVGDELTIDGLYTGAPGSIIQMDLALVSGDPQAGSDLLILDPANPATGTSDFVFNIVSTGVTATTADANRVAFAGGQILAAPVTVVENRGNLTTSSGDDNIPLARSGLITYDLVNTAAAGGDYQVVSQFDAGLAGGLLLPIPATLATVAFTTQRTPNPITATCIDPDNKPNAQGGWVRGLAGEFNTETAGKASIGGVTSDLESDNRTRYRTLQGGFDHVWCNIDSFASTLHFGVTVGQTWGNSVQQDPDPAAGIFGTDVEFDTFFVGPYAAFTRGNFAAQASLRYDYHSLEISNPTVGVDAAGLDVDAEGISGSASMSYDFALATLTVTPDIGVNVSNTEIDSFDIAGGTVVLDDLWSVIGHAGVTARTEPLGVADNLFVVPFASATLYHEFIEHADGQLKLGGTDVDVESNRVGTFGQLGIGANAVRLGDVVAGRPTVFGGARFDLQVGERIEGATATVFGRVQF